jgi:hypothetical protein
VKRSGGVGSRRVPRGVKSEVHARGTLELRLREIGQDVQKALEVAAPEVLAAARAGCPKDSGDLASSLYISKLEERGPNKWRIEIIAPKPYAAAQERGSGLKAERRPGVVIGPILILPKKGGTLSFFWPGAPARFVKYRRTFEVHLPGVLHPGVPPTRFLRNALRDTTSRIWTRVLKASSGHGA